ncbi:MAG: hypothetical protein M5U26_02120 [Planctomycetota bacterium]|nr:hypothetical protein [Planctomycetota bacterium]
MNLLTLLAQGLLCLLLMLFPVLAGAVWVRRAWRTSDLGTALALGAVVGLSAHLVALNALSYLLRPAVASGLLSALEAAALLAAWRRDRTGPAWNAAAWRADLRRALPVMLPVALAWAWDALDDGGTDQLTHSAKSAVLAVQGLPSLHPYDTQSVFVYHYGPDLLAAGWGGAAGWPPWWTFTVWLALLQVLTLLLALEALRAGAARAGAALGAWEIRLGLGLFALGGSLAWVDWLRGIEPFFPPQRACYACEGFAYVSKTLSMAAGWAWLLATVVAVLRWPETLNGRASPALPFGLLLGALTLLAPHAGLPIAMVLLAAWACGRAKPQQILGASTPAWRDLMLAAGFALGLALVQGGAPAAALLRWPEAEQTRLVWSGSAWPSFAALCDGRMTRILAGDPRWATLAWRELGPALAGFLPLGVWAFWPRPNPPVLARWLLLATAPCLFAGLFFELAINPFETYRFNQFALSAAYLALGLALGRFAARGAGRGRLALSCVLALLLGLQGIRYTLQGVGESVPYLPFVYPRGQVGAVAYVESRGALGEGISTGVLGFSAVPGLAGRPVRCADPGSDRFNRPGEAWTRALETPSPFNLRAAGCRWVAAPPDVWARAAPLLEGLADFEAHGVFGNDPPFRLYRYAGAWAWPEGGLATATRLERHPATQVVLSVAPLEAAAVRALF